MMGCIWLDREAEQGVHMSRAAEPRTLAIGSASQLYTLEFHLLSENLDAQNTISVCDGLLHAT